MARTRNFSEFGLLLFTLSFIVIAVSIPILNPTFILPTVIIILVLNVWIQIKLKLMKNKPSMVFRILNHFFLIIFNLTFLFFYLKQKYFSCISIKIYMMIGYIAMVSISVSIICEFFEALTELFVDFSRFVKKP